MVEGLKRKPLRELKLITFQVIFIPSTLNHSLSTPLHFGSAFLSRLRKLPCMMFSMSF